MKSVRVRFGNSYRFIDRGEYHFDRKIFFEEIPVCFLCRFNLKYCLFVRSSLTYCILSDFTFLRNYYKILSF